MVQYLKHSIAATEPRYLALRRIGLMIAQAFFALIAVAAGLAPNAEVLWSALCLALAAAMVVGIPGLWFGLEWSRRLCFVTAAVFVALIGMGTILTLFGPQPFSFLSSAVVFVLFAAHTFWLGHRETRDELARVRERRRSGSA